MGFRVKQRGLLPELCWDRSLPGGPAFLPLSAACPLPLSLCPLLESSLQSAFVFIFVFKCSQQSLPLKQMSLAPLERGESGG